MDSSSANPQILLRAVNTTRRRLVASDALRRTALLLPAPLIYLAFALAYIKVVHPDAHTVRLLLWGTCAPGLLLVGAVFSVMVRGRSALFAAMRLDRVHELHGRVANAVAFLALEKRSPLEECAVLDATRFASTLSPAAAAPVRLPKPLWWSAFLAGVLGLLTQVEVRHARLVQPPAASPTFTPFTLAADDQEFLKQEAERLAQQTTDPEAAAVVNRFNQLVEDMAQGRLDQKQVLQRMEELQQALVEGSALEREALDDSLRDVADSLAKSQLTKPAAQALQEKRLPDAEEALRQLAEKLRQKPAAINRQQLDKLRAALEAASRGNQERLARIEAQRNEGQQNRERLLKKKNQSKSPKEAQAAEKQLQKQERELKRLDRQKRKAESAARQMSDLDRELAKAAQELMKELGDAAKSLESGAESLHRTAAKQLSDQEKEALKKQLQELKELVRQAKSGNKDRQKQLEQFRKRARGGKPESGGGRPGPGQGKPQLKLGQGQGGSIEVPVPGENQGSGAGSGGQGEGAGTTPGGEVRGEPTDLKGKTQDVAAAGIDSGQGTASSEVVYGAASRGFAAGGYRKVYTDYKTVAEEVLETDEIPAGYKFYVRRYFQLIRPRD